MASEFAPPAASVLPLGPAPDPLASVEAALGYAFRRRELLSTALTHRSFSNERGGGPNYERLEFLGDSVLGLVAAEWLFENFPDRPEGELAKLKSFLVSTPALSRHGEALGLGDRVQLGVGERRSGGQAKASILADSLEALFGAVFLDTGFEAARGVIVPLLEKTMSERSRATRLDAKTTLQELVQGRGWKLPAYRLVSEVGPDHSKVFTVEVLIEGAVVGVATGRSKKQAEQSAASGALDKLDLLQSDS